MTAPRGGFKPNRNERTMKHRIVVWLDRLTNHRYRRLCLTVERWGLHGV